MKKFLGIVIFLASLVLFPHVSFAQVVCQPIYGGGQTCVTIGNIAVNKQVLNPQTNQFVDNLGVNDPKFSANQTVTFKIIVTNTGGTTIGTVNATDVFPQFVNFVSGPGSFNQSNRTLSFSVGSLNPGESREFTLAGRIATSGLPSGVACVVNQINVTGDSMQASDVSQLCIEQKAVTKGGLPVMPPAKVTVTPPTGPEMLPLIGLLPAGIGGWFLRRLGGKK